MNRHCKLKNRTAQAGFTLVEIAIVLIVIGIVLGGAIKGLQMYHHSRVMAVHMNMRAYEVATREFIAQYNALPGDMSNAVERITACTGVCVNGGGNHVIGNGTLGITLLDADTETTLYWYHLQAAGLIHDISGAFALAGFDFGESLPASPFAGGYHLRSLSGTPAGYDMDGGDAVIKGLFIRWQKTAFAAANVGGGVITPSDAEKMDRKYDDGQPWSGKIRARGTNCRDGADNVHSNYDIFEPTLACYMYFQIRDTAGL